MTRRLLSTMAVIGFSGLAFVLAVRPPSHRGGLALADSSRNPLATIRFAGKLSHAPMTFEPNVGQTDPAAQFLSRNKNYTLFLTPSEAVFTFRGVGNESRISRDAAQPNVIQMRFLNANAKAAIAGQDTSGAISNYFIGKDPRKWRTHVPSYRTIREHNLYDGIDLLYYGKNNELEHDLVVAPWKNPNVIAMAFPEADSVKLDENGDLIVRAGDGELRLRKPRIYQGDSGTPVAIEGGYTLQGAKRVGFRVGKYSRSEPLVIDPVLEFSTYLGGNQDDSASSVAVDGGGNIYIVGGTSSANFPLQSPMYSSPNPNVCGTSPNTYPCSIGFITKFDPTGANLLYSTYFGGTGAVEAASSAVVDSSGNLYVAGGTDSSDFPTTTGAFSTTFVAGYCSDLGYNCLEAYVAKFNPTGTSLIYSTYLGGAGYSSVTEPRSLAVDGLGQAYVTGETVSSSFPTTTGAYQTSCALNSLQTECANEKSFVSVLNPAGSALVYSTYLGGSGADQASAIAVDASGSAVITGTTTSTDFPLANPMQSQASGAFFTKFTPDGSGLVYSSYFGTINPPDESVETLPSSIALDAAGNVYIVGTMSSSASGYPAFLSKIDSSGESVVYSANLTGTSTTTFGPYTEILDVAVDSLGQAYVTGDTNVTGFPQVNSILPTFVGGTCTDSGQYFCAHGFVAQFNASGSALLFSSYLGGGNVDGGASLAVDASQSIYIVGQTDSSDFPVASAYQENYGGGTCLGAPCFDAFLTKIQPPPISPSPTALAFPPQLVGIPSAPQTVTVTNSNTQPIQILSLAGSAGFSETDSCSGSIPAGSTCTVNVSFTPLSIGPVTGTLTIDFNGSGGVTVVALSGTGIQPAAPMISPASLQFSPQAIGSPSAAQPITLTAEGTAPLTISSVTASGDFAETNTCGSTVAVGSSCSISVVFTPQAPGVRNGQITISDNAPNTPQTISVTGTATGPFAALSPGSLQFNPQPFDTISATQPVTLTNTGTSALNISQIDMSADFGQTNNCGSTISPAATCTISVSFSPTAVGQRYGSLELIYNSLAAPPVVQLTGTGTVSLSPASGSSGSATVTAGQTATYQLNILPQNFSGTVALSCAPVTAIPNANCSVTPNPVMTNGTTTSVVTVSAATAAYNAMSMSDRARRFLGPGAYQLRIRTGLLYLLIALGIAVTSLKVRRIPLALTTALIIGMLIAGCASSYTPSSSGGSAGTPAGTYQLLVTATSGGVSSMTTLTLIVK